MKRTENMINNLGKVITALFYLLALVGMIAAGLLGNTIIEFIVYIIVMLILFMVAGVVGYLFGQRDTVDDLEDYMKIDDNTKDKMKIKDNAKDS